MPTNQKPKNPYSPERMGREERVKIYIDLVKAGYTYQQIADHINKINGTNITRQAVHKSVKREIDKSREKLYEEVKDLVFIEVERLNELFKSAYSKAKKGDEKSINSCLKIMERKAKLLGLDAPEKQEVDNKGKINLNISWNTNQPNIEDEDE